MSVDHRGERNAVEERSPIFYSKAYQGTVIERIICFFRFKPKMLVESLMFLLLLLGCGFYHNSNASATLQDFPSLWTTLAGRAWQSLSFNWSPYHPRSL